MRMTAVVAALALPATSLLAADRSAFPDHRWTLRGEFVIETPQDATPGDGVLDVAIARRLGRHLALEGSAGRSLPTTTAVRAAGGGTRTEDASSGLHAALLLRAHRSLTSSGRTSLSLAAGPSLVSGDAYGTVPLARAELGVDVRFRRRWVFFYGLGWETALKDSRSPIATADCLVPDCPTRYRSGKGRVTSRAGLGLTF